MKNTYKFSVITPVHLWNDDRISRFKVAIESLKNQSYRNFEWVVVDDGSTVPFDWRFLQNVGVDIQLIHRQHDERVISYNRGFELAKGEWFVFLDSDDELKPNALERMVSVIEKYPKDLMFNFGVIYHHKDGNMTFRDPFTPKREKVGHEEFGGGNIVNGSFVFHRSIYDAIGGFPQSYIKNVDCKDIFYKNSNGETVRDLYMGSPYDFSAAAQILYPEIRKYFLVNHENEPTKIIKELGNPWGQDYFLFYKFTRNYHSRHFKEYLYIVHPR